MNRLKGCKHVCELSEKRTSSLLHVCSPTRMMAIFGMHDPERQDTARGKENEGRFEKDGERSRCGMQEEEEGEEGDT